MSKVFPIFVGSGRSGTTLFGLIFDSHPDLAMAHEAHFVAALARRRRTFTSGGRFDKEQFVTALYGNPNFRRLEVPRSAVEEALVAGSIESYADAVRTVFAVFAGQQGKSRYGDKTPGYVNHIATLAALFPEARFLHIIRDGRDVALAYLDRDEWGPQTIDEAALYWRSRVGRGRRAGKKLGSQRYMEVRYETLLDEFEPTVRSICSFLDLEFEPAMLTYYERGEAFAAKTKDPQAFGALALPPTKGLRNWRDQMRPDDVVRFEAIAGGLLSDLGYEVNNSPPGSRERARVAVGWAKWQFKRVSARFGGGK